MGFNSGFKGLRMSDRTVRRILHEDFNFHSYKMVMSQAINDQGTVNRKTVCEVLLNALDNDDLNHVFITGEGNFHLCGNVSSQNCRYWTNENPRITHQKPIHSKKVIVWCGVASFGLIGLYFLEDLKNLLLLPCLPEAGKAVKVNSVRYSEMLCTFLELVLRRIGVETQTFWFQQDEDTARTAM
jgi:hypothetical protein